ncbi:MAG: helix-turn-helix domain-containing protein [Clostridia bacterium]
MEKSKFITPTEVATELGVSKSFAYKLVRRLNEELQGKGFLTVSGKVSRMFFEEKFYGLREVV